MGCWISSLFPSIAGHLNILYNFFINPTTSFVSLFSDCMLDWAHACENSVGSPYCYSNEDILISKTKLCRFVPWNFAKFSTIMNGLSWTGRGVEDGGQSKCNNYN